MAATHFYGSEFFGGEFFFPESALPAFNVFAGVGNRKRWYIVKGKKLFLTAQELALYIAELLVPPTRKQIKLKTESKPAKILSINAYDSLMATVHRLEELAHDDDDDDEEAITLLM